MLHIHPIFADSDPDIGGLYAVRFDNENRNAYEDFKEFIDPATPDRLEKEIVDHWPQLEPGSYCDFESIEVALDKVQKEGSDFLASLKLAALKGRPPLGKLFEQLDNIGDKKRPGFKQAEKLKNKVAPKVLRINCIRIHDSLYVMTGWGLKYGEKMSEYIEGRRQLSRFESVNERLLYTTQDDFYQEYRTYFTNKTIHLSNE